MEIIEIYTDGSCNTKLKIGAWACVVLQEQETILSAVAMNSTNNRMELTAVIKALEFVIENKLSSNKIIIYTDSQYVIGLSDRFEKFVENKFKTKKGVPIRNEDLVKQYKAYVSKINIQLIKVKAHQKKTDTINYNRVVDKLARKLVRQRVSEFE